MKLFKLHPDDDPERIIYLAIATEDCHVRELAERQGIDIHGLTIGALIYNEQADSLKTSVNTGTPAIFKNCVIHYL